MRRTVVINAVGLTPDLLGPHTPRLSAFAAAGRLAAVTPTIPAVTCAAQATYLTGVWPNEHGIVANGWYFADECEIKFWRQSNKLVQHRKVWEAARELDPSFTCANLFWWYNMYSSADYTVTPRPMYPADGRKLPDVYTQPANLRTALQKRFGQFPLFNFWGPNTSIVATRWIANAAKWVEERHRPTLTLLYLPHLDYNLQRIGPADPAIGTDLRELDDVFGDLLDTYHAAGAQVIVLSEYGIVPVSRPVHLNRVLRQAGMIAVRDELGHELLDAGASAAFAVADHQVAHVYVNDQRRCEEVRALVAGTPGVATVLDHDGKRTYHLDHPRSGDFVALAEPDAWFTYYYWQDDARAPDYARTVDIHRKPGFDPAELFIDPAIKRPKVKVGLTLARKQLGFRYLMEVVPLDSSLVRGSHGLATSPGAGPLFATERADLLPETAIAATDVHDLIVRHLQADSA
jgi:predicted AlkP superfamily pyrophosphatase or phosphodiesterase